LQADLSSHRVRGGLAHTCHRQAEGVEGEEVRAQSDRREQRREVAVRVSLADQALAMAEGEGGSVAGPGADLGLAHATAISAAATLRFSAIRML
jgi:hypothetical protein